MQYQKYKIIFQANVVNWNFSTVFRKSFDMDITLALGGGGALFEHHAHDRGLEIGGTWYRLEFQRTAVNTECKKKQLKASVL
jgi:hypothetical protein